MKAPAGVKIKSPINDEKKKWRVSKIRQEWWDSPSPALYNEVKAEKLSIYHSARRPTIKGPEIKTFLDDAIKRTAKLPPIGSYNPQKADSRVTKGLAARYTR